MRRLDRASAEGVVCAKKDYRIPKHPEIEATNLEVIKLCISLKSRGLVHEIFSWQWYYWSLTDEGIEYMREYLHLPADEMPNTLKKSTKDPTRRPGTEGERRGGAGDRGERPRFGDRDGYRGEKKEGEGVSAARASRARDGGRRSGRRCVQASVQPCRRSREPLRPSLHVTSPPTRSVALAVVAARAAALAAAARAAALGAAAALAAAARATAKRPRAQQTHRRRARRLEESRDVCPSLRSRRQACGRAIRRRARSRRACDEPDDRRAGGVVSHDVQCQAARWCGLLTSQQ
jgi:hypothetical protein